jgi:hypothetical protein
VSFIGFSVSIEELFQDHDKVVHTGQLYVKRLPSLILVQPFVQLLDAFLVAERIEDDNLGFPHCCTYMMCYGRLFHRPVRPSVPTRLADDNDISMLGTADRPPGCLSVVECEETQRKRQDDPIGTVIWCGEADEWCGSF